MKLNPFSKQEKLNVSSLNEGKNMLFFCFMLVAPFYVVAGAAFLVDLMGVGPEFTIMTLVMGMAGWGSLTSVHWSNLKSTLAELKLFSSITRFSQIVAYQLDMLFDEDTIAYRGTTTKGRDIYKVKFLEDYGYDHPTEGIITFNKANIVLPFIGIPWKETFSFKNKTQVWYKGLALTCSNSEFTVFDVSPFWDWEEGEWVPTFVVRDCWARGVQSNAEMLKIQQEAIEYEVVEDGKVVTKTIAIENINDPIIANELIEAKIIEARSAITGLNLKAARLTQSRDKLLDDRRDLHVEVQKIRDADEAVDIDFFRDDVKSKLRWLNGKYVAYAVGVGIVVLVLLWIFGG